MKHYYIDNKEVTLEEFNAHLKKEFGNTYNVQQNNKNSNYKKYNKKIR